MRLPVPRAAMLRLRRAWPMMIAGLWMLANFLRILLFLLLFGAGARAADGSADSAAIEALLQSGHSAAIAGRTVDRDLLSEIYAARDFRPLWGAQSGAALRAALADAPSHGLDPGAFALPAAGLAETDILLTDDFLRYARALARGQVTPGDFEHDWAMPQPAFDPVALLKRARAAGVAAALAALPPQDAAYERLRRAYARYQNYAKSAAWRPIALALPLHPGDNNPRVAALRARLAAEGLDVGSSPAGTVYDGALVAAVKKFQAARGLPPDGTVGYATLAALNISPGERMREIRLNLERRRAMPRESPATRVEINVPDSSVVLYQDGAPTLAMRAVVGSNEHPTPVLKTRMTAVTFNPFWNVPASIVANEILPALEKDPDYLTKNDYIYVETAGGQQLVQKPGSKNALGHIKFEMPNAFDIYLHDTPRQDFMDRSRRALSHGCIRVSDPRAMARLVLAFDPAWTPAAIDAAISSGKTRTVPLPHPIPVYFYYWTAWVDADGTTEFRNDIYGRDRRLNQALVARDLAEQLAPAASAASLPGRS
jgi:L,D-transpeptidase YcbB